MNLQYRPLTAAELTTDLVAHFIRRQAVDLCRRRVNGKWCLQRDPFIDDWSPAEYVFLVACLKRTLETGGAVYGAFAADMLKGFVSVESPVMGPGGSYRDLTSLHVSADLRRQGAGRRLFQLAADWARAQGAKKLYLSSHSAAESQAFYSAMGCVDALWQSAEHVKQEPFDCQLEYVL